MNPYNTMERDPEPINNLSDHYYIIDSDPEPTNDLSDLEPTNDLSDLEPTNDLSDPELINPETTCNICFNILSKTDAIVVKCGSNIPHKICEICYIEIINRNQLCPFCQSIISFDFNELFGIISNPKYNLSESKKQLITKYQKQYNDFLNQKNHYSVVQIENPDIINPNSSNPNSSNTNQTNPNRTNPINISRQLYIYNTPRPIYTNITCLDRIKQIFKYIYTPIKSFFRDVILCFTSCMCWCTLMTALCLCRDYQ
jgi:hypothetical protein